MRLRVGFLLTCAAGALLIGAGPMVSGAHAAPAPQVADPVPFWWFHGELEAGGRFFTNNPPRNGVNSAGQNSLAKYYEYSTIKPGAFVDGHVATGSKDGLYQVDVWAKNIGYSDQRFDVDASQAGQQYFNFQWDQTPHIYSTSTQTLYNGIGTNALTLPAGLSAALIGAAGLPLGSHYGTNGASAFTPAMGNAIKSIINGNVYTTDIGIQRDTAAVEYRWTPTTAWDIKADYSHMHRTGSQNYGVDFAWVGGTSGVRVDAPKPVDDVTQNYGLNGEYNGSSPWGGKFNFKLAYNGSTYSEGYDSYTVANPFCPAGATAAGSCARTGAVSSPTALVSLAPSNQANAFTGTLGAELPFKSRYMGTMSYTMMRQNQAFLPFTITPGLFINGVAANSVASLPASSLNGAINTFLSNNVLTTQITPDLKNKLSYRYYDFQNDTPALTFPGPNNSGAWVGNDASVLNSVGGSGSYPSPRHSQTSYIRQNAGEELIWRATRQLNLGAAYGYERYSRTLAEVAVTNENSGKIYADWQPMGWITARASYAHSARRYQGVYDNYNNVLANMWVVGGPLPGGCCGLTLGSGLVQNQAYQNYMYANRDRDQAKFSLAVDVAPQITVTPTAGIKYDNYLNSVNMGSLTTACGGPNCVGAGTYNNIPLIGTQPGLKKDNSWNWGVELSVVATPVTTFMFAYNQEHAEKQLLYCGFGGSNATATSFSPGVCSAFSNSATTGTGFPNGSSDTGLKDKVDTFIATMRHAIIPDQLDLTLSYTLSIANSSTYFNPGPFPSYGTSAANQNFGPGVISVAGGPFPDTKTTYQRFDAITTYKLQQDLVQRLGYQGDVLLKLRYAYESNKVTNWQYDMMQTYMYSANNQTLPYMIWTAGNNPNYNASLVAASLVFKW